MTQNDDKALSPTKHFPAVRRAREALKEKADKILEEYLVAIKLAISSGKYEEGLKAYQWLLDHIPGENGERIFEASSDKPHPVESQKGPLIQIGFALGGIDQKSIPDILEGEKVEE